MGTMIVSNKLRVKPPNDNVRAWCEDNLVLANPEYEKKRRMNKWIGNTPRYIHLYEEDGEDLLLPFGVERDVFPLVERGSIDDRINLAKMLPHEFEPVKLYGYQEDAVEAMRRSMHGVLQAPAGSGKTQCGIALIQRLNMRTLWITHTQDLLRQSMERAEQYIPKRYLGTITEGKAQFGEWITFATVQTMCNLDLNEIKYRFQVVIVDECHRISGSPTNVTMFYKVLGSLAAVRKYGLSATLHRSDGMIKACFALIGDVAHRVPDEAVSDKILPVRVEPVWTGFRTDASCLNFDGTLDYQKMLTAIGENDARNAMIRSLLMSESNESILILSSRVKHLQTLMEGLPPDIREVSALIDGKMVSKRAKQERAQAIDDMRSGKKRMLFATYQLAKEGLDIPRLTRLYMVMPQKDMAVIVQSVGRIARTFPGKDTPICRDFVDSTIYCQKAWKKRCTIYRKNNCLIGG